MSDETFRPRKPTENGPIEIKGNVPEEFQKMLQQNMQESAVQSSASSVSQPMQQPMMQQPMMQQPMMQQPVMQQPMMQQPVMQQPMINSNLKEILDAIKKTTENFDQIILPSKGKFYDGTNGPKDGILHIRPMRGEDEQILGTPRYVKKGVALDMIYQNCIKEPYKVQKLLTVDRTFILLYLRGISYSSGLDVETSCPECDQKFSTTIDLSTLNVEKCDDNTSSILRDVLPSTGLPFSYRFSTGEDDQNVSEHRERRSKAFGDQAMDDTMHYKLALLTDEIGGVTNKNEIQIIIKNLPMGDVNYLRNCTNEPPFGVDTEVELACPNCLYEFEMELPNDQNFFFPKKKKQEHQA